VANVVRKSGWIYSAGSTLPYLALRARLPGVNRAALDSAIFEEEDLVEIPTVRGCTMLVPAEDVALALAGGRRFVSQHEDKIRAACNIKDREIHDLRAAATTLLKAGPLSMEMLRGQLPMKLVRDLGASGKSLGERSTLTFVMRLLQREMVVQRVAADRRLDSESYAYRLPGPKFRKDLSPEEADCGLAHRFFKWASPATLKEFAWWAGMSQREARQIIGAIGMVRVSVDGWVNEAWIPAETMDQLNASIEKSGADQLAFLPFRDNYLYFRRGLGVFLASEDRTVEVLDWMRRPAALGDLDSLHHNSIILGGRLVGFWEYDPEDGRIVSRICSRVSAGVRRGISSKIADLQDFIQSQLGDAAFYSFDRGKNRRHRIDSLRVQEIG
jgi:hypothetical protein